MRMAVGVLVAGLAIGASGCLLAALQLAPVALQAAESLGSGVVNMAGAAAASNHSKDPGGDEIDSEERCDELQIEVPGVIEFRAAQATSAEWRELRLSDSIDSPQWEPLTGGDSAPGGWHPAVNLARMNFVPPIGGALKPGVGNYLAYAPNNPQTSVEQDQLVAMTVDFGAGIGTFQWKGRTYQYSIVRELPCFPAPLAMK